jgi:hypothetical protein
MFKISKCENRGLSACWYIHDDKKNLYLLSNGEVKDYIAYYNKYYFFSKGLAERFLENFLLKEKNN